MGDIWDDGDLVEGMIAEGRRIIDAAIEEYDPVAIIGAFSGGNDSIVTTHFACEHYGALAVHCETSIGLDATRRHVAATCMRFGWDLRVRRAEPEPMPDGFDESILPSGRWEEGATAYEQFVLNFGFPGPSMHGRMYQRLKLRPLAAIQRELKAGHPRTSTVLIVSGIRHDESSIRAGYKRDTQKEPGSSRVWVNPFYWRTAGNFEVYRQEFGLPRNPVKARIGISGECLCGSFAGEAEKEAIRSVDPGMGNYLDDLESRVRCNGFPWGGAKIPPRGCGTPDAASGSFSIRRPGTFRHSGPCVLGVNFGEPHESLCRKP